MDPILGSIIIFAGNFAPKGWAFCNGQSLAISQNSALFALLGTTYGGNGTTTFNLPDLRGRAPVSAGQGPGLSNYSLGQQTGIETVTLNVQQMPTHTHAVNPVANPAPGNTASPAGSVFAQTPGSTPKSTVETFTNGSVSNPAFMASITSAPAGNNQPHTNVQPVLAINYIIALQGIFPSRD